MPLLIRAPTGKSVGSEYFTKYEPTDLPVGALKKKEYFETTSFFFLSDRVYFCKIPINWYYPLNKAERYRKILEYFALNQPVAETELVYSSPYELIVSTILSAQCTDKRVNIITPGLFRHFPTVYKLAFANEEEVFELIKSCSYPNNKTKHLIGMAKMIVGDFNGSVPSDVDQLQKLPGVGRKTANVIASVAFNLPKLAVDTHVFRVAARLGLTYRAKNPLQTELQLIQHIPEEKIPLAHHWLLLHGRYVCQARRPKCEICGISQFCKYFETLKKKEIS